MTVAELTRSRLYGILDLGYVEVTRARKMAEALVVGGVDLLQLRAKNSSPAEIESLARELHSIAAEHRVPLIINDHPQVTQASGADGVHLGQDDLTIAEAREIVGPRCAVGKSTHSVDQAIRAFYEGADYIGFGPIFATPTKPDYSPIGLQNIATVHESVRIPIFCIGGIKLDNLAKVIEAGALRVVIVSGLLRANDPAEYARSAKQMLSHRPLTTDL